MDRFNSGLNSSPQINTENKQEGEIKIGDAKLRIINSHKNKSQNKYAK